MTGRIFTADHQVYDLPPLLEWNVKHTGSCLLYTSYLELDGRKIAVVQSYRAKAAKSSRNIEAFGESEPVATIEGQKSYTVELTRLYATDTAISDGIDFYSLTGFSLVICKPDRKVIYSGCEWSGIQEDGELNATVAEKVTLTAARRIETTA